MVTRESLQMLQGAGLLEHLGIEFDRRVRAEGSGTAAGALLALKRMRGAVGAEKEPRMSAGRGRDQRKPMMLALEDRQAIQMRANPADEHGIAVVEQVMGCDGRG